MFYNKGGETLALITPGGSRSPVPENILGQIRWSSGQRVLA